MNRHSRSLKWAWPLVGPSFCPVLNISARLPLLYLPCAPRSLVKYWQLLFTLTQQESCFEKLFSEAEPSLPEVSEDHQNRWERSAPGSRQQKGSKKGRRKSKPSSRGDCKIRTLHVRVQDLGLGYDSEELVLFKYCAGSCQLARSNHDVTLSTLLQKKIIHGGRGEEKISSHPCCRPTRYEPITFMDIQNRWKAVEKLSAAECSCLG
ncbi:UNVERIFIED_CONTAM: hypothetical protein FKN15_046410 [Acipenser sinensis]